MGAAAGRARRGEVLAGAPETDRTAGSTAPGAARADRCTRFRATDGPRPGSHAGSRVVRAIHSPRSVEGRDRGTVVDPHPVGPRGKQDLAIAADQRPIASR